MFEGNNCIADFADQELKTVTFAVKFGSAEKATKFKEIIEQAKKVNAGELDPDQVLEFKDDDDEKEEEKKPAKVEGSKESEPVDVAEALAKDLSKVKVEDKPADTKAGESSEPATTDRKSVV